MEYQRFVALRQELWDRFEEGLARLRHGTHATGFRDLEELAAQYRQVLHDQAAAQARFGGTGAARRLQRLGLEGTYLLRRDETASAWSWRRYASQTLPAAMQGMLPRLGVAAAVFAVSACFGLVSTLVHPDAATLVLGPERIRDLAEGRLWTETITNAMPPAFTSSAIATNNISVSLLAWAGGAAGGVGALYLMLLNGFLLGATFGVTYHYGMAGRLGEFVAAHGPLEITITVVCAAAGLGIGRALVVATDRPRSEVLRSEAGAALAILAACVPWLVVLALVEGFVSPAPELPVGSKAVLGVVLLGLFVLLAWRPLKSAA